MRDAFVGSQQERLYGRCFASHHTLSVGIWGGRTIANSLRAFSGQSAVMAPIAIRAATLMLVLISMVVCPTIFLIEWRRRRLKDKANTGRPPLRISGLLYTFCGWITIVSGAGLIPVAYFSEVTTADLRHRQAIQENRDQMINELNLLSVDAAQVLHFSKSHRRGRKKL